MKNYFTDDELKCKCCGKLIIDQDFREKLNQARELSGFPWFINSGYRCPAHNTAEGSTSDNHPKGKAVDVKCLSDRRRYKIIRAMIAAGILGIGINEDFIHGDTNRTTPAIWTY